MPNLRLYLLKLPKWIRHNSYSQRGYRGEGGLDRGGGNITIIISQTWKQKNFKKLGTKYNGNISSYQGTHFMVNENVAMGSHSWNSWSYCVNHYPEAAMLIEQRRSPLKIQLWFHLHDNTLRGEGDILQDENYALHWWIICALVSPIDKSHGSRKQIVPSNLQANILLTFHIILGSASLEVLGPKREIHPLGDTAMFPLNWKLRLPLDPSELLMPLNLWSKRVAVLAGVMDPDYQGENLDCFSTGRRVGRKMSNMQNILWYTLILKVKQKLKELNESGTANVIDPSGMKVWITHSTGQGLVKVLLRTKGICNG